MPVERSGSGEGLRARTPSSTSGPGTDCRCGGSLRSMRGEGVGECRGGTQAPGPPVSSAFCRCGLMAAGAMGGSGEGSGSAFGGGSAAGSGTGWSSRAGAAGSESGSRSGFGRGSAAGSGLGHGSRAGAAGSGSGSGSGFGTGSAAGSGVGHGSWAGAAGSGSGFCAGSAAGVRFHTIRSRTPAWSSAHTAARALPPAPSTNAVRPSMGSPMVARRPGASVLSAWMWPSLNVSVFAAPIAAASSPASSASASAASLWGIVTFAPANPTAPSARAVSAKRSGGTGRRW